MESMQQPTESPTSAGPGTTVEGRCPGHVRSGTVAGELAFSFDGEDLRALLGRSSTSTTGGR